MLVKGQALQISSDCENQSDYCKFERRQKSSIFKYSCHNFIMEQKGFIFIADISGFTNFVISVELLEILIDVNQMNLKVH